MELVRALAVLCEPPAGGQTARLAAALSLGPAPDASDYTETFLFQLYPYASVYLGAEGMLGGEARARIADFWRALGQTPPVEPDHLALLLALYARLHELEARETEAARRAAWARARRALLWEHLLSWLPAYLTKLAELAPPFYRAWGEMLSVWLDAETRAAGTPELLPAHLRAAPPLADPRADAMDDFLSSLLAPARSGIILARADLMRAARELDLGARIGERKFILKALFDQDARSVLDWLSAEASVWASRHRARRAAHGALADWWAARAADTAALLTQLRAVTGDERRAGGE